MIELTDKQILEDEAYQAQLDRDYAALKIVKVQAPHIDATETHCAVGPEPWTHTHVVERPDVTMSTCTICGFERDTDDCQCRVLYPGLWIDQTK